MRKYALALVAIALLLAPSVAAACQTVREPAATICHYGDPRLLFTFDNSASNVAVPFRGVFRNAVTGVRQSFVRTVAAHDTVTTVRWAMGAGSRASVYDNGTGDLLARITVLRGVDACPR